MKSRNAGRSRVEVESAPRRNFLDKQNVTVTTNKKIGRVCLQFRENAFGIARGASTNVGHPDIQTTNLKAHMFRPGSSRRVVVNVAEYGPAWGHLCQCIGHT